LPRSEIKRSTVASRVENEMATGRQARERERERRGRGRESRYKSERNQKGKEKLNSRTKAQKEKRCFMKASFCLVTWTTLVPPPRREMCPPAAGREATEIAEGLTARIFEQ